jgi:hypothetical protein
MVTWRILSSNYLGVGLAIATGLAANLGSSLEAQAQVNPNIQTQLNIVSPPQQAILAQPANSSQLLTALRKSTDVKCPPRDPGLPDLNSVVTSLASTDAAKKILESVDDKSLKSVDTKSSESITNWPAPGSADTELGVLMEPEVCHGETEVYTRVQA